MKRTGVLEVIVGPMYSGKTEELIRLAKRATFAKKNIQMFKHDIDLRYGKEKKLYSHAGSSFTAQLAHTAEEIQKKTRSSTYLVGIDEAQWFGEQLIPIVLQLVKQRKYVIVSGLGLTYDQQPFVPMPQLMALADTVTKLTAVCTMCGNDAIFHIRVKGKTDIDPLIPDPSLVMTLRNKEYEARCRQCVNV
jgi:thymidine kinase